MAQAGRRERIPFIFHHRFLIREELEYELDIRGVPHTLIRDTKELVSLAYRNRKREDDVSRIDGLDVQQELVILKSKVAELHALYEEAKIIQDFPVENSRLGSLFVHVSYRLRRIQYRGYGKLFDELSIIAKNLQYLHEKLTQDYPGREFPRFSVPLEEMEELTRLAGQMSVAGSTNETAATTSRSQEGKNSSIREERERC